MKLITVPSDISEQASAAFPVGSPGCNEIHPIAKTDLGGHIYCSRKVGHPGPHRFWQAKAPDEAGDLMLWGEDQFLDNQDVLTMYIRLGVTDM